MHIHSNILVQDNGMWSIKTGFAGDEAPRHLERSLVGVCKNKTISKKIYHKEFYSSQNILSKKEILNIKSPVQMVDCSHIEDSVRVFEGKGVPRADDEEEKDISFEQKKKSLLKMKDSKSATKSLENVELDDFAGILQGIVGVHTL